jgi:hypothetical protein
MTPQELDKIGDEIAHKVLGLVESHPRLRGLTAVAQRNMAKSAGWAATAALTHTEIDGLTEEN